jgi:MFS family permease
LRIAGSLGRAIRVYGERIGAFSRNARLYLVNVAVSGAVLGVYRLLFNFYVLSLGYDEALLGNLITASSLAALLAALPMGYLANRLGRKSSLVISAALFSFSIFGVVAWPVLPVIYAMNILLGVSQSLGAVTMAPFLMENSGSEERTYLFSISSGLQMAMASAGNWIGGYLPTWVAQSTGALPTGSTAYAGALLAVSAVSAAGIIPLLFLRTPRLDPLERSIFAPLAYAARYPARLGKLVLPILITSIGAGLIMPFMNVFYRQVYNQPDPVIGTLFAWGSLAMGIGLLIAPPLAERMGKIQLVVISQAVSIPFLVLLGFSPWFWMSAFAYYVRLALMNMSTPVYQTFVMEQVEAPARAMVASLVSMAWNFGWAFSPTVSGWMQVNYGFGMPFLGTIVLYTISVYLYWVFFWKGATRPVAIPVSAD